MKHDVWLLIFHFSTNGTTILPDTMDSRSKWIKAWTLPNFESLTPLTDPDLKHPCSVLAPSEVHLILFQTQHF